MANFYAIPSLSTWSQSTLGWSSTSGGASNGSFPGSNDVAIFDANSGSARVITCGTGAVCGSLTTTGSAIMGFTGALTIYGPGTVAFGSFYTTGSFALTLSSVGSGVLSGASMTYSTVNITAAANTWTLGSNLTATGAFTLFNGTFSASTYAVIADQFSGNSGGGTPPTINMGSGTWTMTGNSGTLWSLEAGATLSAGTSTLAFTGNSTKTFAGGGKTYYNVQNSGLGNLTITGNNSMQLLRGAAGTTTLLSFGSTQTTSNVDFDGTAGTVGQTVLKTTSNGTTATLALTAAGRVVDRMTVQDIVVATNVLKARSCANGGNNTNITFIGGNSNFTQFF